MPTAQPEGFHTFNVTLLLNGTRQGITCELIYLRPQQELLVNRWWQLAHFWAGSPLPEIFCVDMHEFQADKITALGTATTAFFLNTQSMEN